MFVDVAGGVGGKLEEIAEMNSLSGRVVDGYAVPPSPSFRPGGGTSVGISALTTTLLAEISGDPGELGMSDTTSPPAKATARGAPNRANPGAHPKNGGGAEGYVDLRQVKPAPGYLEVAASYLLVRVDAKQRSLEYRERLW